MKLPRETYLCANIYVYLTRCAIDKDKNIIYFFQSGIRSVDFSPAFSNFIGNDQEGDASEKRKNWKNVFLEIGRAK